MSSKKVPGRAKAAEAEVPEPFVTTSSITAFEHFTPMASQVSVDDLEVCRADVELVRVNIGLGVDAIRPHVDTIERKLPECPLVDVLELPALALALVFSTSKVVRPASTREIEQRLASVRLGRELALLQLEIFAGLKLIPAEIPAKIRAGQGPLDSARDAVAIVGVFRTHADVVAGKHPFTVAFLDTLATDGDWLIQQLRPRNAKTAPAERDPAAIVRDQLWSLIRERHEHLRQAGAIVFGLRNVDRQIPLLGARVGVGGTVTDEEPEPSVEPSS